MMPTTRQVLRDWHRWECDCPVPSPGWWNVECRRCLRPILTELERILAAR